MPALVAGSVPRRLLAGGGVLAESAVCGADDLRDDGLGVVRVWAMMEVVLVATVEPAEDSVSCDDILFSNSVMT